MHREDLLSKIQFYTYALRRGKWDQLLAGLVLLLFSSGIYLNEAWKQYPLGAKFAYAAFVSSAVCFLWLILRIWKRAAPPPPPQAGVVPSAIKGLLPFTATDGKLFARLGRDIELSILMGRVQDPQTAICVVRGQSGAGKTSLLQAGLAYAVGENQCVYWEAIPTNAPAALLHAVKARFLEIQDLDSLPTNCPSRCILILDQFEQLNPKERDHAPVFNLLDRIAKSAAPRKLTAVVGFRREFAADWLDFEQARGFRAEQVPIDLLAEPRAKDAFITLASEAGLTVDNALVSNFTQVVRRPDGISPVDVAIGILGLANFAQRKGQQHIGNSEYQLAGGAQGLLRSFVEQKLEEEVPDATRAPLLKGMVLSLVDLSKDQRVPEGASASTIASRAEVPDTTLRPWLERLTHPRIRLLEKPDSDRYRLPHERLVPVLRQLTGTLLASLDRLKLVFEDGFVRWTRTASSRNLLTGKELRDVSRNRSQFLNGEDSAQRTSYLAASLARRNLVRGISCVLVLATAGVGFLVVGLWKDSIDRRSLMSLGIPPQLLREQEVLDSADLSKLDVTDVAWLHHDSRLKELKLQFSGSTLAGIEKLTRLTSLDLKMKGSQMQNLAGLDKLTGLTSLTLSIGGSKVENLTGLDKLTRLTSLTLDLGGSEVQDLAGLDKLSGLTSLKLDLVGFQFQNLAGLDKLSRLTSLTLDLRVSQVQNLAGLDKLTGLTSLSLNLRDSKVENLAGLDKLTALTSLTLDLGNSQVENLRELDKLTALTSLTLSIGGSKVENLAGLDRLTGLTSLTLDLQGSKVENLAGLDKLTGLTSLKLSIGGSKVENLAGLDKLTGLTSLTLSIGTSEVQNLAGLDKLTGLTSLTLDLEFFQFQNLAGLDELTRLTSLTLDLKKSQVQVLAGLDKLTRLTSLTLDLEDSEVENLAGLDKLTALTSLTLDLGNSQVENLRELDKLTALTSLTLSIGGSNVENLVGLDRLTGLTSLTLDLVGFQFENLAGLDKLSRLTSLTLDLTESQVQNLAGLDKLTGLTSLSLNLIDSQVKNLSGLDRLAKLKTLELNVPASIALDEAVGKNKGHITNLTIYASKDDRLRVPLDCKFVKMVLTY